MRPEQPLVVAYLVCFIYYMMQRPLQSGKALYWLGAGILTLGVLKMKG